VTAQSRPGWPWRRLALQLAPAVLVSGVGVALLSQIATPSQAPAPQAPADVAITAEAVFTATPRKGVKAETTRHADAGTPQAARPAVKPKPQAIPAPVPLPPRLALITEPLPPAPPAEATPAAPPPAQAPAGNALTERLRRATAALERIPQWARSLTEWGPEPAPPRPPAPIPSQDFARIDLPPSSVQ